MWKPFVQSRVQEIRDLTDPSKWYHCPGLDNPADLVTRGLLMSELVSNNIWVSGPSFLLTFSESFPNEDFNTDVELEVHNPEVVHVTNDQER